MASSNLIQLTQSPAALAPAAISALIDPLSGVTISDLVIAPQPGGTVIITPTQAAYADPTWAYYGHAIAAFQPLDLSNVFGGIDLRLTPPSIPGRTGDIATLLAEIFDVLLTPSDVVDISLPVILGGGTPFILQASPSSVMWKGQLAVTLFPTTVATTNLTDLILTAALNGLTPPSLADMVTTPVVNGLTLAQLQGV